MPELRRRSRRRVGTRAPGDFTTEREARAAALELLARYGTAAAVEASAEWPALRARLTRWILRSWRGLGSVGRREIAARAATTYLFPIFYTGLRPEPEPEDR